MQERLDSLLLFYKTLLLPLKNSPSLFEVDGPLGFDQEEAREEDPLWHLGHAAFEIARVLLAPFLPASDLPHRYGKTFQGPGHAYQPYEGGRASLAEIIQWYEEIFVELQGLLPLMKSLPYPEVELEETLLIDPERGFDYILFHTGLHLGRVHQMLDW